LAEDYLKETKQNIDIAWYQNISANTLYELKNGIVDIALVYEPEEAEKAIKEGWASNRTLIFNDHFLIVGPNTNPSHLNKSDTAPHAFAKIAKTANALPANSSVKLFLSRDDGSGTNMKERTLWTLLELLPWEENSPWYIKLHDFPKNALITADKLSVYTLTDRGTWLSNRKKLKHYVIYIEGGDVLRNPCFALLNQHPNKLALDFLHYLQSDRAQTLIKNFGKKDHDGEALFTSAKQLDFK